MALGGHEGKLAAQLSREVHPIAVVDMLANHPRIHVVVHRHGLAVHRGVRILLGMHPLSDRDMSEMFRSAPYLCIYSVACSAIQVAGGSNSKGMYHDQ